MNLVFLGPPGSGKGTQARRLAEKLRLAHLSTGDVLRRAVREATELGRKAQGYMSRGELVPDDLIIALIEQKITSGELENGFILDGYPRTVPQAESLNKMFAKHQIRLDRVILFKVGQQEIMRRLLGRARIEGRADDTRDVIRNRLEVYTKQTRPIELLYVRQSILVEVEGEDTPDNIFGAVLKVVN